MKDKNVELARQWLEKANHDLITAKQTLALPDGPTDTPCFHAQQAVEKALKALLTSHQIVFPKIHDLVRLLDMAITLLPALETYRELFSELSGYAVEVRYPGDWPEPPREDAQKALSMAEEVVILIQKHLTPQIESNSC